MPGGDDLDPRPDQTAETADDTVDNYDASTWPGYQALAGVGAVVHGFRRALIVVPLRLLLLVVWIGVPLLSANLLLQAVPYRTSVAGVDLQVRGSLFDRPGLSADTTLGSWEFSHVTGLPVGAHVTAVNVDVLAISRGASGDTAAFVADLRSGVLDQVPQMALWLVGETVLGLMLGMAVVVSAELAVRQLRGSPRRPGELRLRVRQGVAAVAALAVVATYGAVTYNPNWTSRSRLTGTLAAIQLFPDQLREYYAQQGKAYDALGAVIAIQGALQQRIDDEAATTAYNIMYISDVHLAAVYPLVAQYVHNFDVKLIVNTGDEAEFGTAAELSPAYLAGIAAITATVPMLWIAGNHDSPEVAATMAAIPGVTVLGEKTSTGRGAIAVSGTQVTAGGLTFAGIPDPRVYGGSGEYGSDDKNVVDKLERDAMDGAVAQVSKQSRFDVMLTHEPVAAKRLQDRLPGQVRQLNSGHTHAQNSADDVQSGSVINLVEGSTGAGGLDNLSRTNPPPIEFSIESVTSACQFSKVSRFQIDGDPSTLTRESLGSNVTVSTIYLDAQKVASGRTCAALVTVSTPKPLS